MAEAEKQSPGAFIVNPSGDIRFVGGLDVAVEAYLAGISEEMGSQQVESIRSNPAAYQAVVRAVAVSLEELRKPSLLCV